MLARLAEGLPTGDGWLYEPKWDGFRALVHRRGTRAEVVSRHGRSLTVAFADVAAAAADALPDGCVVDGELVAPVEGGVLFDGLLRRLSGGGSAASTPAALIAFDLLQVGGDDVMARPLSERRRALEALLPASGRMVVNLQTPDVHEAQAWLDGGALTGVEGVVAKRTSGRYQPGQRGCVKVKRHRTAEVVVGGFRGTRVLLGLYDAEGRLHHVGETVSLGLGELARMATGLSRVQTGETFTGRPPGVGRHQHDRLDGWVEVRPEVVVEVSYTLLDQGGRRFRHAVRLLRLRPDREPASCTKEQLHAG
jgi:ATP-dependent DNA ligase